MKRVISIILTVIMLVGVIVVPGVAASVADIKTGTLVTFGEYPQTSVIDSGTLAKLNAQSLSWKYYDYYCDGRQENYMKYADVTLSGDRYRAVSFTHYRPYWWNDSSSYTYQDDNGYEPNNIYWFRYDPIVWRVLDADEGLIMAENLIDSQPFHNEYYYDNLLLYGDQSFMHYASDWAYSSLRVWMNNDFCNTAFDAEKGCIKTTSLNTPSSYLSDYDAEQTKDKVFLLSAVDVVNSSYGFGSDINRIAYGTDYARCQGLEVNTSNGNNSGASWWRLRTPHNCYNTDGVGDNGQVDFFSDTYYTHGGIRPALKVDLESAIAQSLIRITNDPGLVINGPAGTEIVEHSLIHITAKAPTCIADGNIEYYYCEDCGKYFTDENAATEIKDVAVKAAGHDFGEWKVTKEATIDEEGIETRKCSKCGEEETRPIKKPEFEVVPGDIDGNGQILADDARLALRFSAKLEELDENQQKAADVDGNGQVLADDARQILRFSAKLQFEFEKA
ncbi:MAG: dockerin type I repeat-containing protein [Clostridia bacterium]|nr:dockerin type I repeat-containing protein [Clostridia bacterium]